MAEFSAADAALEGFRLTREQPRTVAVWAGLMLAASLVSNGLAVTLAGEALGALGRGGDAGPEATLENFRRLGPFYLVLLPLAILFSAAITAAIYRAVLRPSEGGPGHLRLGGDELRLAGATVLIGLLLALAVTFMLVLAGVVTGGLAAGAGAGAAVGGGLLVVLLVLGVGVFLAVRLSLALPATFVERRIRVFESFRLTKGRFWPLLGAYVLAIILALVIFLLAMMIYFAVAALLAGGVTAASSVFSPDFESFGTLLSPAYVIYLLIAAVTSAVTTAITTAPAIAAYRDITGYGRDTAEVFS